MRAMVNMLREEYAKPADQRKNYADIGKHFGVSTNYISMIANAHELHRCPHYYVKAKKPPKIMIIAEPPKLLPAKAIKLDTKGGRVPDAAGRYFAPPKKPRTWTPGSIAMPNKQQLMGGR